MLFRLLLPLPLVLCVACPARQASELPTTKSATPEPSPAKLVLTIVLDQLPTDALLRYGPHLAPDGLLRRAMETGLYQERVRLGYAGTNTAPGHASIFTGTLPAVHGIDSNDVFDYELDRGIKVINDGKHAVFGVDNKFGSPWRLLVPTIGDELHKLNPASKVISVSLKARAAIVSAGKTADFVAWYSPKKPGFTTSTFYAAEMPGWLATWNEKNPVSDRINTWEAENPELYERLHGPDAAPGEASWYGLGNVFPHDPRTTEKPTKTFLATPQSMQYLLDMTRALVDEFELGEDDAPDLLSVSVSTTDYAGHSYSTNSWEYLDVLIKTDRALTALVAELESKTELAVLITSDHGGTPLAEATLAKNLPAGRVEAAVLVEELEALADRELGEAHWIQAYIQPYLYISDAARSSEQRSELVRLIIGYAEANPGLAGIFEAEKARTWGTSDNWLERDVANTVAQTTEALFVVPAEGYVASPGRGSGGTGHGTPWIMDREVPVLAVGVGVSAAHTRHIEPQDRVAPTIAALLGLRWHLEAKPLSGTSAPQ